MERFCYRVDHRHVALAPRERRFGREFRLQFRASAVDGAAVGAVERVDVGAHGLVLLGEGVVVEADLNTQEVNSTYVSLQEIPHEEITHGLRNYLREHFGLRHDDLAVAEVHAAPGFVVVLHAQQDEQ